MKRYFNRVIPSRRYKRSILGTISTLIVVLFLIKYLLEVANSAS
ncbi:MAG: hypothetical protein VX517_05045 [Candidatus Neomarinimicrobiota bacterium]|nr:hypothetical protein [Candidatus Neomarinimicrobiota bacterium]